MNDPLISESLREVWRWKEKVAREYEGLSKQEVVRRMNEEAERIMCERGIRLPRWSPTSSRK